MKVALRPLGYLAVIAVVAGAYYLGRSGQSDSANDSAAALPPDPGYAAKDAVVVETGYDGRERYRLNAREIRQRIDSSVIDIDGFEMDYHVGTAPAAEQTWHLRSDRGQVRGDGEDVQLDGNVVVTGKAPGNGGPITVATESLRINTPTEFIETDAPVRFRWGGYHLDAVGLRADLKAGNLRLESNTHGTFSRD